MTILAGGHEPHHGTTRPLSRDKLEFAMVVARPYLDVHGDSLRQWGSFGEQATRDSTKREWQEDYLKTYRHTLSTANIVAAHQPPQLQLTATSSFWKRHITEYLLIDCASLCNVGMPRDVMHSADACSSVCHTPVLCRNGWTYHHTIFTIE